MDFQSAMETFAEAWVAANTKGGTLSDLSSQSQALALTRSKSPVTLGSASGQSRSESKDQPDSIHTPAPPMSCTPNAETESIVSPPSMKDGFDKTSSGKSLPVHCVVETICSVEEVRNNHMNQWRRRPIVETDSFVIIPISTPFQELVQVALHRLGYPSDSASAAKGSLIMKNWKPLAFDQITDDPMITVGDILGELTTVATLRIQMYRSRPSALTDVKDKLLKLLLMMSHGRLLSSGCPLDEHTLSQMCRGDGLTSMSHHVPEMSEECRRKFNQWWAAQLNSHHLPTAHSALYNMVRADKSAMDHHQPSVAGVAGVAALQEHVHPAMQTVHTQYPTQRTRMRTSFDPELELPKLQRWFAENQHPSRQQIQQYVKELNGLESRRGRKPLDVNNVVYWFKNARAAQKRAEVRNISPGLPGLPCHLTVNGYGSTGNSPPNGSGMLLGTDPYHRLKSPPSSAVYGRNPHIAMMAEDMSMADSDMDEDEANDNHPQRTDDEHAMSPTMPLSLTTHRKRDGDRDRDGEEGGSPRSSTPASDQKQMEALVKKEVKEEPVNLHASTGDLLENNNNSHASDVDENGDEKDGEDEDVKPVAQDMVRHHHHQHHMQQMQQQQGLCSPTSDPEGSPHMMGRSAPAAPGAVGTSGDSLDRLAAGFPLVPNSMFSHSIIYMGHYIPGLHGHGNMSDTSPPGSSGLSMSALAASAADERRKRNRTFIDPVTEVPRLEQWFSLNTHPSHNLILKYTEELNCMAYRQKFPKLEPKNVQFWFKNRRAKCKRLKMSLFDNQPPPGQYHHDRE